MNQPHHNIFSELLELSPAVAAIPRVNVFQVPDDYFSNLPSHILLNVSNLSGNAADVPAGYFDGLATGIMARIREESAAETSDVLDGIGNNNIFDVPQGYFEGLASQIISRVKKEETGDVFAETHAISATVAAIGNKNIFSVPGNYFEELPAKVYSGIPQQAKVVSINNYRKFFRYAAAAFVTGVIALSAVFIINKNETGNGAAITASGEAIMDTAQSILKSNSFDKEMASLSDADIVNFLESKGQDVDAALVASLSEDEKLLPEADDYLLDEHALDDILKKLDLNN